MRAALLDPLLSAIPFAGTPDATKMRFVKQKKFRTDLGGYPVVAFLVFFLYSFFGTRVWRNYWENAASR